MSSGEISFCPAENTGCNESSPLINDRRGVETQRPLKVTPTPIPKVPLLALCAVRLVEPIAFTQIFPWINEFIRDLHLTDDPSRIGFYSGIIESAFAIAQLLSIYQWARLSDKIGRRPVLLTGTAGAAISAIASGLSESFASTVLIRSFAGLCLGCVAVIHSMLCELSDPTNQAVTFPLYGIFWPFGTMVGPLIGGSLSHPATKYPTLFGYGFLRRFPYFLPCFVVFVISLLGFILGYFFLEETLPSKARKNKEQATFYRTTVHAAEPAGSPSMKQLFAMPIVRALCASGFALSFLSTSFDVVFVLFCYSPIQSGGLAFSASRIGYSLSIAGAIACLLQVTIIPYLLRRVDSLRIYNFAMDLWPYVFIAMPLINLLARSSLDEDAGTMGVKAEATIWICIALTLSMSRLGWSAYAVSMLLVKENASPGGLGATNGLVQGCMCLARSIAPAFVSSSFVLSVDNHILGGHLWVVLMVFISWRGSMLTKKLKKARDAS